jgi:hypothetical protein
LTTARLPFRLPQLATKDILHLSEHIKALPLQSKLNFSQVSFRALHIFPTMKAPNIGGQRMMRFLDHSIQTVSSELPVHPGFMEKLQLKAVLLNIRTLQIRNS